MTVRVALVQIAVTDEESVTERVARVLDATRAVAAQHDLLVLPELWSIGAFATDLVEGHAESLTGPIVTALAEIARDSATWVFGGSIPEVVAAGRSSNGMAGYANTAIAISPQGDLVGAYRKVHLFGFNGGETAVMTAGDRLVTVDTPLGRVGLATCYDLRFPELFRALVDRGAEVFVIPAGWPERRLAHWEVLARARAIENQAYVLACNESATHAGVPLAGHSLIIDPQGEVLAEAGVTEQVLSAELDPARVSAWRSAFPALEDRRTDRWR